MPILADSNRCVGCTSCANICPKQCIEMNKDSNGFVYAKVVHLIDCIECGMCERICPILNEKFENNGLPFAYAALSKEESIRINSSSGGIFTEVAKIIISQNGVVYGAAYDEKFEVNHCCVDNVDELHRLQGAKYAESSLNNSFSNILERLKRGQQVLFSGTPCQISGLHAFLRKKYNNLFCIDFVCHGVPSPMAWKAYVEYRAKQDANGELPQSVNLRSKETGWSRYQYSNVFEYENGKQHSISSSDSLFMKLFVGDYISRPSCENCKFKGYNRVSDITLGDFWGIWDIDPEMDDNKGTSVVLIQTEKGQALWNEISGKIKFKEVSLEQASWQNPSMLVPSKANSKREEVLKQIREGGIAECENLFVQSKISMVDKIKGKMQRLIYGKRE